MTKSDKEIEMDKKKKECPRCDGSGKVESTYTHVDQDGEENDKKYEVYCPKCHGTGTVEVKMEAEHEKET